MRQSVTSTFIEVEKVNSYIFFKKEKDGKEILKLIFKNIYYIYEFI